VSTEESPFWVPRLPEISDGLGLEGAGDSIVGLVDAEDSVIALVGGVIALVGGVIALVGGVIALAGGVIALTEGVIALAGGVIASVEGVIALAEGVITLAEVEDSVMEFVEVWDSVGWIAFKGFEFVAKPGLKAEVVFNGRLVISG
jgi:hypothetical protein